MNVYCTISLLYRIAHFMSTKIFVVFLQHVAYLLTGSSGKSRTYTVHRMKVLHYRYATLPITWYPRVGTIHRPTPYQDVALPLSYPGRLPKLYKKLLVKFYHMTTLRTALILCVPFPTPV